MRDIKQVTDLLDLAYFEVCLSVDPFSEAWTRDVYSFSKARQGKSFLGDSAFELV